MFGDHHLRPWYKSVEVDGKSREAHCSGPPETAGAVVVVVMASCILDAFALFFWIICMVNCQSK